jgi:hypothetical protein
MRASKVSKFWNENFSLFASRACHEGDLTTLCNIFSHRHTIIDRLIIGMSMDEEQARL